MHLLDLPRRGEETNDELVIRESHGVSQETEKRRQRNTKPREAVPPREQKEKKVENLGSEEIKLFFFFLQKKTEEKTTLWRNDSLPL